MSAKHWRLKAASFWKYVKAQLEPQSDDTFSSKPAGGARAANGAAVHQGPEAPPSFPSFPPPCPSPRKCSSGPDRRRDFERSGCSAGCWAHPEYLNLRTCSAFVMRLLGAAAVTALGRGPLPRIPAVQGWQGKQVFISARRDETELGTLPGTLGPSGVREVVTPFPFLATGYWQLWIQASCLCAEKPIVPSQLPVILEQRLGAPGGWTCPRFMNKSLLFGKPP